MHNQPGTRLGTRKRCVCWGGGVGSGGLGEVLPYMSLHRDVPSNLGTGLQPTFINRVLLFWYDNCQRQGGIWVPFSYQEIFSLAFSAVGPGCCLNLCPTKMIPACLFLNPCHSFVWWLFSDDLNQQVIPLVQHQSTYHERWTWSEAVSTRN